MKSAFRPLAERLGDVAKARKRRLQAFDDFGRDFVKEPIGNLADIGLTGHALIAQHMREVPDLGDEALGVHGATSLKGLTMVRPPNVRPCCMSSVNSVSQLASCASTAIALSRLSMSERHKRGYSYLYRSFASSRSNL